MSKLEIVGYIISLLFILNVVFSSLVVFFERRSPSSTWAWLFVLSFLPGIGFIIYIIFGRNTGKQRLFLPKLKKDSETIYNFIKDREELIEEVQEQIFSGDGFKLGKEYSHMQDFATLNLSSGSWMTHRNEIEYFIDGKKKFASLVEDIRNAKEFIHMEYYILRSDRLGKTIVEELTKKVKEGVEVRLTYDFMGNITNAKHFVRELKEAGGHVAAFTPSFFIRLNYRNHRKIAVIDGKIGYVGGFNIGDEYLGMKKRFGYWRDTHIRIKGEAVDQLQLRFMMDWNFCSKKDKFGVNEKYYPPKDVTNILPTQIVSSGPDTKWKNVRNSYFKMINEAEKSIYIATPYFVPDDGIFEALRVAALSGIDVRLMIPANPDHPFVYWASMSYAGELMEAGVKVYEYQNGFIHSKVIYVDGIIGSVGTANMDIRSFALNLEVNAFIYDEKTVCKLQEEFIKDIAVCKETTLKGYTQRGKFFKFRESVARLISPML